MLERPNPRAALLSWMAALKPRMKRDLFSLALWPLAEYIPDLSGQEHGPTDVQLASWLLDSGIYRSRVVASKITTIRAHITPLVQERIAPDWWPAHRAHLEHVYSRMESSNELIESAQASFLDDLATELSELPELESAWKTAGKGWLLLLDGALADAALADWAKAEHNRTMPV